jgi:murein DD-endopeptidase MepM/ murein hydrolase activator NlpD
VHLRHANGFETEYLHLSVTSVRTGARVRQGELIGRVGSTGLATGAHLDYRLKKDGAFINPVTGHRAMPPAEPIPAEQMAAYETARREAMMALSRAQVAAVANPNAPAQ